MGNPYAASFIDQNNEGRLVGQLNFTDSGNQPGGSSSVLTASAPLTNAQIIALGTQVAPVEIVPTPGSGSFINFMHGLIVVDASTVAYGGINAAGTWDFELGESVSASVDNSVLPALLGGDSEEAIAWVLPSQFVSGGNIVAQYGDRSQLENFPLILQAWNNNAGAYTGGDAANSGKVKVWYTVETLL